LPIETKYAFPTFPFVRHSPPILSSLI
jgi:hypothetical protein